MKSTTDFQTGSILLLTATLLCIGLAIAVIAPIIDNPLAGSRIAQVQAESNSKPDNRRQTALLEFYPPVTTAHHSQSPIEFGGGQQMNQSSAKGFGQFPIPPSEPMTVSGGHSGADAFPPNVAVPGATFTKSSRASSIHTESAHHIPGGRVSMPAGSVYAPITIHQPLPAAGPTNVNVALFSEKIERLVTEREQLANSLRFEKQRQIDAIRIQEQKRRTETQQQQIASLETELKTLNLSIEQLQSKTTEQFTQISEQNSRVDIASQALKAYRDALALSKQEAARTALELSRHRTAHVESGVSVSKPENKNDVGRVHIPLLPPTPDPVRHGSSHQHSAESPQESPAEIREKPQTAEASFLRLRQATSRRAFAGDLPQPQYLPLPAAKTVMAPQNQQLNVVPDRISQESPEIQESKMKFIPLDAPKIREFNNEVDLLPEEHHSASEYQRSTTSISSTSRSINLQPATETDVAFEHTYQFDSAPVVEDFLLLDPQTFERSHSDHSRSNHSGSDDSRSNHSQIQTVAFEEQSQSDSQSEAHSGMRFEAIDFPDLGNSMHSAMNPPTLASPTPSVSIQQTSTDIQADVSQKETSMKPSNRSWIQRLTGSVAPIHQGRTRPQATAAQKTAAQKTAARVGGRGRNRHVHRSSVGQSSPKLPKLSLKPIRKSGQSDKARMMQK